MKTNLGALDKTIRIILSLALILLLIANIISGVLALPGWLFAIGLMATGIAGYCPLYGVLGINTRKNLNDKAFTHYRNQKQFNWYN